MGSMPPDSGALHRYGRGKTHTVHFVLQTGHVSAKHGGALIVDVEKSAARTAPSSQMKDDSWRRAGYGKKEGKLGSQNVN